MIRRLSSLPQAQTGYAPVTFIILRDISSSDDVLEMEVPQEVNLVTVILYMLSFNYFINVYTVPGLFQDSLNRLMSTLRSTNVHYIRCIKPNSNCQPGVFDRNQVC